MKTLFVAWQDPISRSWFPIGRLTFDGQRYQFLYIKGAIEAQKCGFPGVWSLRDFYQVYESTELPPLFANRVMGKSRPDYPDFIRDLNLNIDDPKPQEIAILSRTGGQRVHDHFEVFPLPEPDNGIYRIHFFVRGIRYLSPQHQERIAKLAPSDKLRIVHDVQNPYDPQALLLLTEDFFPVGYCPRYLLHDNFDLLRQEPQQVEIVVERVNPPPTATQLRLLCHLTAPWHSDFRPFVSEMYQPLAVGEGRNFRTG